jgi:hypothetical protein
MSVETMSEDFERRLAEAPYGTLDLSELTPKEKDYLMESGLI